jgi:hypothetical protein
MEKMNLENVLDMVRGRAERAKRRSLEALKDKDLTREATLRGEADAYMLCAKLLEELTEFK